MNTSKELRERADEIATLSLKELEALTTLKQGHTDDLKIESDLCRIWLSRLTVEDGQPYDNQVTIELLVAGKWVTCKTYQAK